MSTLNRNSITHRKNIKLIIRGGCMTILPIYPSVPYRLIEALATTGTGLTMALKSHLPDLYDEDPGSTLAGHWINPV